MCPKPACKMYGLQWVFLRRTNFGLGSSYKHYTSLQRIAMSITVINAIVHGFYKFRTTERYVDNRPFLRKVLTVPTFASSTFNGVRNADNDWPPWLVQRLLHSTSHTLKSPAITTSCQSVHCPFPGRFAGFETKIDASLGKSRNFLCC